MVLQCFFTIDGRAGSLGSYITEKTGLLAFSSVFMDTLSIAFILGINFALLIAEFIMLIL